jgi:hypothetical protein
MRARQPVNLPTYPTRLLECIHLETGSLVDSLATPEALRLLCSCSLDNPQAFGIHTARLVEFHHIKARVRLLE